MGGCLLAIHSATLLQVRVHFASLEKKHGRLFVSHTLGYITAGTMSIFLIISSK